MFEEDLADTPSCKGMTEAAQRRAAAAFRGWLLEGLFERGIENVRALAYELDVPPMVAVTLLSDNASVAAIGARLAQLLHLYLNQFGCFFVAAAGGFGDKATLTEPSLGELIDDLVAEWDAMPDHGFLTPLSGTRFRRLLVLVVTGAFARVSMRVVCDCVPDDDTADCEGQAGGP